MLVRNGMVFMPDDTFCRRDIRIENGKIAEIGEQLPAAKEEYDAKDCYVLPGLCDIHSHGAMGCDFSDADEDGLKKIVAYERSVGVTAYMPTSMTIPKDELKRVFVVGGKVAKEEPGIVGFHMEGPFVNPAKKGAQKEEDIIAADVAFFDDCNALSGGKILKITVAPEMPGADAFIRERAKDTAISIGHTTADYDTAKKAMEAGAKHLTHMFNAMPAFTHRNPGVVGAAADTPDVVVELIADGVHIHPAMIRSMFTLFKGRIALISDSMRATGLTDGAYTLGGQDVTVRGRKAVLNDGTIAGSVTNLFDCMRFCIQEGVAAENAIASATRIPAAAVGIGNTLGSIQVGLRGDILICDKNFLLKKVI